MLLRLYQKSVSIWVYLDEDDVRKKLEIQHYLLLRPGVSMNASSARCARLRGQLTFVNHLNEICKSANQKVNALHRIRKFTTVNQTRSLCYAFIYSKFNYCSLLWMFCGKVSNQNLDRVQKRALRVVYNKPYYSLDDLLQIDHSLKVACTQYTNSPNRKFISH